MDRELFLIRTHVEELLTDLNAIEKWLDSNEPVKAYKGILRTGEHIKEVLKDLDDKYGNTISTSR